MTFHFPIARSVLIGGLLAVGQVESSADTSINPDNKYAWGGNTGWINFAPTPENGVSFGESYLSGYAWDANTGWILFGDGTPDNGYAYSNSGSDFGVNHDGAGALSGYAWSANTGWLNAGWAGANDPNRPRVDLITGAFAGYLWGGNIGWINLGTGRLVTDSMDGVDTDSDGIADSWERKHFGDLTTAGIGTDADSDGVTDASEYVAATDPKDPASFLRILSESYAGGFTSVELEFSSSPERLYEILFSSDLGLTDSWTGSTLGTFSPDQGASTTRTIGFPGSTKKFFRIRALRPLSAEN